MDKGTTPIAGFPRRTCRRLTYLAIALLSVLAALALYALMVLQHVLGPFEQVAC